MARCRRASQTGSRGTWWWSPCRDQLAELAKAWERGGRHIAGSAATIALVAQEPEDQRHRDWVMYDFGQATVFMMLAAADLGIGSGHSAVARPAAGAAGARLPGGYRAVCLIGLGYPADRPLRPLTRPWPPALR